MKTKEEETWKDIPGYEGVYMASNLGRIRRMYDVGFKILKISFNRKGYCRVSLTKDGKSKGYFSHRLVAYAFIPNPENKPQVNHINGIKDDNRVENLEWNTNIENLRHALINGLSSDNVGTSNSNAKLKEADVISIRKDTRPVKEIATQYGMHWGTIYQIRRGEYWKHLK